MECKSTRVQNKQMEVDAPFQIKYPKLFNAFEKPVSNAAQSPARNTGARIHVVSKPVQSAKLNNDHELFATDGCLKGQKAKNPYIATTLIEERTFASDIHGSCTEGFIHPDVFPPRLSCPFTFFKHDTSKAKAGSDHTLHPLEITPKDMESTSAWTKLPYDSEQDSKALENELPLEIFDEIRPKNDKILNLYLKSANKDDSESGTASEETHWTGWSRWHSLDGKFCWKNCKILNYDKTQDLFEIQWECESSRKTVKRLNLFFKNENEVEFQQRIRAARLLRTQMKTEMVFRSFVDGRAIEGPISILDEDACRRINFKVDASTGDVQFSEESLLAVKDLCLQCLKEVEVQMLYMIPHKGRNLEEQGLHNLRLSRPVPAEGCVQIHSQVNQGADLASDEISGMQWKQYFAQLVDISERSLLIARASFLQTLQELMAEWDISALSMFHCALDTDSLPISLAGFCSIQEAHLIDTTDIIRSDWIYKVMTMMESLNSKGRISVDSSASTPQARGVVSEDIGRLAKMISLMMSNQLKSSVLLSIIEWETFWANYSTSLQNSEDSSREHSRAVCPLFEVGIVWDGSKFEFQPKLEDFRNAAVSQLERMMVLTSDVSDISAKIDNAASDKRIPSIDRKHQAFVQAQEKIQDIFWENEESALEILEQLSQFQSIAKMDENSGDIPTDKSLVEAVVDSVLDLNKIVEAIDSLDHIETQTPLYCVETRDIEKWIISKAKNQHSRLLNLLVDEWSTKNDQFLNSFHSFELQLTRIPATIEELCEIRLNCNEVQTKLTEIQKEVSQNNEAFVILHDNKVLIEDAMVNNYWQVQFWPEKLKETLQETQHRLNGQQKQLEDDLQADICNLEQRIELCQSEIKDFATISDFKQHDEKIETGQDLKRELEDLMKLTELYKSRQLAIQLPVMDSQVLADLKQKLELHLETWLLAASVNTQIPEILEREIDALEAVELHQMLHEWDSKITKLAQVEEEEIQSLLEEVKIQIDPFIQRMPLMEWSSNKDLQQRHWDAIGAALGLTTIQPSNHSVKSLMELGADKILEEMKKQSEIATEEAKIHRALTQMQNQWNYVKLETSLNDQIEDNTLVNAEEIRNQCSLQLEDLDSLKSTNCVIMEQAVKEFGRKLSQVKEMVSTWIACQDSWIALKPVLKEEGLIETSPNEHRKLVAVNALWKQLVQDLSSNAQVIRLIEDQQLCETLKQCLVILEEVQESLQGFSIP